MSHSHASPWAIRGLYLFSLVLVFIPLMDLMTTVWPVRPGDLPWRYGFLGLAAGYLHTPMLGLVIAAAVAYWDESRGLLKGLGITMMVGAAVLLLVMALFALDVVQMRGLRAEEVQSAVLAGGFFQEIKYLTAALTLVALGIGCSRTAARQGSRRGSTDRGEKIVTPR